MKNLFFLSICFFAFLAAPPCPAQDGVQVSIGLQRLSERVLILTEDSPMENIVTAIASEKGLIVIDTAGSYITAAAMRGKIVEAFGRDDFAYVINTHYHWDHSRGNQVFGEATIIGHRNCIAGMRSDERNIPRRIEHRKQHIEDLKVELESLEPDSEEARDMTARLAFSTRNYRCDREGFVCTPPQITFEDRMRLDCGDLTLELVYFGRAHSGSDILILVPEEGLLLTGDLFLDIGWLPLFAGMNELDVPRFIEALGYVLDETDHVRTVIPGHRKIWSREKLVLWRDYIVELWAAVQAGQEERSDFNELLARTPLRDVYRYPLELGHTEEELLRFHENNLRAFFRQTMENAAAIVGETIRAGGIEAGLEKYAQLRAADDGRIAFNEAGFNALGYNFLQSNDLPAAIAVFKLNVEANPRSWNVYDSLAEAYMAAGEREKAIENYTRSIELNPGNENGKSWLEKLREEEN